MALRGCEAVTRFVSAEVKTARSVGAIKPRLKHYSVLESFFATRLLRGHYVERYAVHF